MAANTAPIFPLAPAASYVTLTTASTNKDGTGATLLFTAGTNGALLDFIRSRAMGTNTATVLRVFLNNGSDPTVAANNALITEKTIAGTTLSEVAELDEITIPLNLAIPGSYRIYVALGTTVAAGLKVSAFGGQY